jgi:hypothetical protein
MKFQVFIHFGRVSGTPGAVGAGPAGVTAELTVTETPALDSTTAVVAAVVPAVTPVPVGTAVHLVQTVEVTVDETVMVETVVPTSTLVVPAEVWVEVNGQVVRVVTATTVVMATEDSTGRVTDGVATEEAAEEVTAAEDPVEALPTTDEDAAADVVEATSVVPAAVLEVTVTKPELLGIAIVEELPKKTSDEVEAEAVDAEAVDPTLVPVFAGLVDEVV